MMESLYIHIPFCDKVCTYCDFAKEIGSKAKQDAYIDALIKEITTHKSRFKALKTIFIGGGTPSILSIANLEKLGRTLKRYISLENIEEFTMECNPNDLSLEKLKTIHSIGVNRLSLGVQTFHDNALKFLNRSHQTADVFNVFNHLKMVQFDSVSVDMLFGLPGQTLDDLHHDLKTLLRLNPDHISYYNLIVEEQTRLYHLVNKGDVTLPDDDLEATMFETIIHTLRENDYSHYEISNFGKSSHQGYHNVLIWRDGDYLGLGVGAHSKYDSTRYFNPLRIKHYLDNMQHKNIPNKTTYAYEPMRDFMLNGLRLLKGINVETFQKRFNQDVFDVYPTFERMIDEGFLTYKDSYLALSHKGLMYGNAIFSML